MPGPSERGDGILRKVDEQPVIGDVRWTGDGGVEIYDGSAWVDYQRLPASGAGATLRDVPVPRLSAAESSPPPEQQPEAAPGSRDGPS
jgi:hypothetical protein